MHRSKLALSLLAVLALASAAAQARAQTLSTLVSFGSADGGLPLNGLTLSGSTLYGTTNLGGPDNMGTVFSVPVTGGPRTVLASFNGTDGDGPRSRLAIGGSTMYGVTREGGANSDGTVFSVPMAGGTPTVLTSFNSTDGALPQGSLTLSADGSTLYGMTYDGGQYGYGTIFSIPVTGGMPTTLASFNGTDGAMPNGQVSLTLVGSTLYGMTEGGGAYGDGAIFSIPTTGGTPTVLHSFTGADGGEPENGLILVGSMLYGAVGGEGTNNGGGVFSIPLTGGGFTSEFFFNGGTGGEGPNGSLTLSADGTTFYGVTSAGGNLNTGPFDGGSGTIFSIPVAGGPATTLFSFDTANGLYPNGDLTLIGSTLYGTAFEGGSGNRGTVFALSLATPEPSSLVLCALGAIGLGASTLRRTMRNRAA